LFGFKNQANHVHQIEQFHKVDQQSAAPHRV
jgi:hypothetical protein